MTGKREALIGVIIGLLILGGPAACEVVARHQREAQWRKQQATRKQVAEEGHFTPPGAEPLVTHDHDTARMEKNTEVIPFATTWTNRCGMLVHDYFLVAGDGQVVFQGSYID